VAEDSLTVASEGVPAPPQALSGKTVLLKANFNSADPFPASTHLDTLRALVAVMQEAGAGRVLVAERSGMGDTRQNLDKLGVLTLAAEMGFEVVVLDELTKGSWAHVKRGETHWLRGFYLPKVVFEADVIIQTCCLKTHRFGGHFTMSLKNSVGLVAKKLPGSVYDYMWELHGSPYQRLMIAEINAFYRVDFAVLDAARAFISGGPDKGAEVAPEVMLASSDRVALDAAGLALLVDYRASGLAKKPIFAHEQIRRAAELGVGAVSASEIELIPLDERGRRVAERVMAFLQ